MRTFHDERERTALLIADFRPSMLWGTRRALRSVAAAEALALAGWRVNEAGGRTGLDRLRGGGAGLRDRPGPGARYGLGHRRTGNGPSCTALLASAGAQDLKNPSFEDQPLATALEMAAGLVPAGGAVFLATALDNPGEGFDGLATALNRRAALTVLVITDAFERRPPSGSYPFLSAGGRIRWAAIRDKKNETALDRRIAHLRGLGINAIPIDASAGPEVMAEELDKLEGRVVDGGGSRRRG